jgi:hypothetical protein
LLVEGEFLGEQDWHDYSIGLPFAGKDLHAQANLTQVEAEVTITLAVLINGYNHGRAMSADWVCLMRPVITMPTVTHILSFMRAVAFFYHKIQFQKSGNLTSVKF